MSECNCEGEAMRNPLGWDYPAGAEHDPNAPWNQSDDHHPGCACNEDAPEIRSECGGEGECTCYPDTLYGRFLRWWNREVDEGFCVPVEPECTCADLADDDKASAADARAASREEGWERP